MIQVPLLLCSSECCEGVSFAVLAGHHACHDEEARAHQVRCIKHDHAGHACDHAHESPHDGDRGPAGEPGCGSHALYFVSCLATASSDALPAPARALGYAPGLDLPQRAVVTTCPCEGRWPTGDLPEVRPPAHDPVGSADRLLL